MYIVTLCVTLLAVESAKRSFSGGVVKNVPIRSVIHRKFIPDSSPSVIISPEVVRLGQQSKQEASTVRAKTRKRREKSADLLPGCGVTYPSIEMAG